MIAFSEFFLLFVSCSFIGWILECLLLLYQEKRLINRGFLTGPMIPLYGVGAVSIVYLLGSFKSSPILLFLTATILSAVIEYLTSVILEKVFHTRWWDYSNEKYNINGRLNIVTLVAFGFFGLVLIYGYYPLFCKVLSLIPKTIIYIMTFILFVIVLIDSSLSLMAAYKLKKESMNKKEDLRKIDSTEKMLELKQEVIKKKKDS